MSIDNEQLVTDLMTRAVCSTDHSASAATALMVAAGKILHAKFGACGALGLMRSILDETEAVILAQHGRQAGEAVQ